MNVLQLSQAKRQTLLKIFSKIKKKYGSGQTSLGPFLSESIPTSSAWQSKKDGYAEGRSWVKRQTEPYPNIPEGSVSPSGTKGMGKDCLHIIQRLVEYPLNPSHPYPTVSPSATAGMGNHNIKKSFPTTLTFHNKNVELLQAPFWNKEEVLKIKNKKGRVNVKYSQFSSLNRHSPRVNFLVFSTGFLGPSALLIPHTSEGSGIFLPEGLGYTEGIGKQDQQAPNIPEGSVSPDHTIKDGQGLRSWGMPKKGRGAYKTGMVKISAKGGNSFINAVFKMYNLYFSPTGMRGRWGVVSKNVPSFSVFSPGLSIPNLSMVENNDIKIQQEKSEIIHELENVYKSSLINSSNLKKNLNLFQNQNVQTQFFTSTKKFTYIKKPIYLQWETRFADKPIDPQQIPSISRHTIFDGKVPKGSGYRRSRYAGGFAYPSPNSVSPYLRYPKGYAEGRSWGAESTDQGMQEVKGVQEYYFAPQKNSAFPEVRSFNLGIRSPISPNHKDHLNSSISYPIKSKKAVFQNSLIPLLADSDQVTFVLDSKVISFTSKASLEKAFGNFVMKSGAVPLQTQRVRKEEVGREIFPALLESTTKQLIPTWQSSLDEQHLKVLLSRKQFGQQYGFSTKQIAARANIPLPIPSVPEGSGYGLRSRVSPYLQLFTIPIPLMGKQSKKGGYTLASSFGIGRSWRLADPFSPLNIFVAKLRHSSFISQLLAYPNFFLAYPSSMLGYALAYPNIPEGSVSPYPSGTEGMGTQKRWYDKQKPFTFTPKGSNFAGLVKQKRWLIQLEAVPSYTQRDMPLHNLTRRVWVSKEEVGQEGVGNKQTNFLKGISHPNIPEGSVSPPATAGMGTANIYTSRSISDGSGVTSKTNPADLESNQTQIPYNVFPGQLITYGDTIADNVVTTESGQILYIDSQKATLRKAQTVLIYSQAIITVLSGEWIKKGTPLMSLSYQKLVTGDIVQGLPKIEQFFEAPVLKDGNFWSDSLQAKLNQFFQEYREKIPLAEAVRKGFLEIQRVLVEGVQRVYISQGVLIADKHLEVIVRQMTCKGRILYSGDTGFLRNELVSLDKIENVNQVTYGQKALYHPQVRGITDASLESESFLSAASFQETTRVLSRDAIVGKTDLMRGLKERVIVGELIQAGTGLANNSVYNLV